MAKHIKRYVKSLVIREIQTKTTRRYHLSIRMAIILKNKNRNKKKQQEVSVGEDVEKLETLYTVDRRL